MSEVRVSKDYIADNYVTLRLKGLRYIMSRRSIASPDKPVRYYLEWGYKGQRERFQYPTKEERDMMYEVVSMHLLIDRSCKTSKKVSEKTSPVHYNEILLKEQVTGTLFNVFNSFNPHNDPCMYKHCPQVSCQQCLMDTVLGLKYPNGSSMIQIAHPDQPDYM